MALDMVGLGMTGLGALLGGITGEKKNKVKYFDPRSAQQKSLASTAMMNLSDILGSGGFTGNMRDILKQQVMSSADEGYLEGLKSLMSAGLDPKSLAHMKGILARNKSKAVTKGNLDVNTEGVNRFMQALQLGANTGFAAPPNVVSETSSKDGNFGTNFANNLGGILGYSGGKRLS